MAASILLVPALSAAAQAAPAASRASLPIVTSVSPARGSADGFQPVLVRGSGLAGATAVLFGQTPAATFDVRSDQSVLAVAPDVSFGRVVHVRVRTAGGLSARTTGNRFTFIEPASTSVRNATIGNSPYGYVNGIDCPARNWCLSSDVLPTNHPLALSVIAGDAVHTHPVPVPADSDPKNAAIFGLSCSAAQSCIAVGSRDYHLGGLIATFDHGTVTSVPIDGVPRFPRPVLWDASCDPEVCVAAGEEINDDTGRRRALIVERGPDGTWAPVALPTEPGLYKVSCAGTSCVALGAAYTPVVLVRTAAGWQESDPAPPAPGQTADLTEADCYAQDACVAYGSYRAADGKQHQLFERWDGAAWTAVTAPRLSTLTGDFNPGPLTCTASGICLGAADANSWFRATPRFVARLDGDRASVTALPVRTGRGPVVGTSSTDLACSSPTFCVLGANYDTHDPEFGQIYYDTLVYSNGVWTDEDSPRTFAASCVPPGFCALGGENARGGWVRTITQS